MIKLRNKRRKAKSMDTRVKHEYYILLLPSKSSQLPVKRKILNQVQDDSKLKF